MSEDSPKEIAFQIKECYDLLPKDETDTGADGITAAMIMEFRRTKLKIASECVFASLGINRNTGERT